LKHYELRSVLQLFSYFIVFVLGPTFGSLEEFGGVSKVLMNLFSNEKVKDQWEEEMVGKAN
jgi:hypothetical protein